MNESGISLLEVLIAMIIMAVGIMGLAPMIVLSVESNNISREIIDVTTLAKQKLEEFESADTLPTLPYTEVETGVAGYYDRHSQLRDNTTDSLVPSGVCQADITILWTDKSGLNRSTTYSTFLDKGN